MSWNSGGALESCWDFGVERVVCVESGGEGETTISRHWGPFFCFCFGVDRADGERVCVPVGVWMVSGSFSWRESVGAMDWKAWIGSASKNSWATIKGVLSGA